MVKVIVVVVVVVVVVRKNELDPIFIQHFFFLWTEFWVHLSNHPQNQNRLRLKKNIFFIYLISVFLFLYVCLCLICGRMCTSTRVPHVTF